jgi:hypothetical protein
MLMIKILEMSESALKLKLEGKLMGPWVDELKEVFKRSAVPPRQTRLDLAAVAFVDPGGVEVLDDLVGRGVKITSCSAFVAELLAMRP